FRRTSEQADEQLSGTFCGQLRPISEHEVAGEAQQFPRCTNSRVESGSPGRPSIHDATNHDVLCDLRIDESPYAVTAERQDYADAATDGIAEQCPYCEDFHLQ